MTVGALRNTPPAISLFMWLSFASAHVATIPLVLAV